MNFSYFSQGISQFLSDKKLTDAEVYLTDMDGYLLYTSKDQVDKSLIALIAGVYQGSRKLFGIMANGQDIPSLSLGEGHDNLFVTQLNIKGRELLLSSVLKEIAYPARYKLYLKHLADNLVENYPEDESTQLPEKTEDGGFLFSDISDDEVDRLFQI